MKEYHRGCVHMYCMDSAEYTPNVQFTAVITDPPYGLRFMGKKWDYDIPNVALWKHIQSWCYPGAMLLSFAGTRTQHRMGVAIEDAGWELRDTIMWLYGSGFPKSLNISKAIDKELGVEPKIIGTRIDGHRQTQDKRSMMEDDNYTWKKEFPITKPATPQSEIWDGYGTALKPAYEPIIIAMKPLDGTFAHNAMEYGVAGLNINGSRVGVNDGFGGGKKMASSGKTLNQYNVYENDGFYVHGLGRWPANIILNETAAEMLDEQSGITKSNASGYNFDSSNNNNPTRLTHNIKSGVHFSDKGGASRFFYVAKASKRDRGDNNTHPTVKPSKLMEYLVTLFTMPEKNHIIDPFVGSGTTLLACARLGIECTGIERDEHSFDIAVSRLEAFYNDTEATS